MARILSHGRITRFVLVRSPDIRAFIDSFWVSQTSPVSLHHIGTRDPIQVINGQIELTTSLTVLTLHSDVQNGLVDVHHLEDRVIGALLKAPLCGLVDDFQHGPTTSGGDVLHVLKFGIRCRPTVSVTYLRDLVDMVGGILASEGIVMMST